MNEQKKYYFTKKDFLKKVYEYDPILSSYLDEEKKAAESN